MTDRDTQQHGGRALPEATLERLTVYLRALEAAQLAGQRTVSSETLASAAGANPAILRKDLSLLGGSFGRRGVGYDVPGLADHIGATLGLKRQWRMAIIGAGNLGRALAGFSGFRGHGFELKAILDQSPTEVGRSVAGLRVSPASELESIVAAESVNMAVIAVPGAVAQGVCDQLVAAGIRSILNFAPVVLQAPAEVNIRQVDMSRELQILAYYAHQGVGHQDAVPPLQSE
ncbi:redox-sensing transcriptional repressor Rex [Zhihengliuella sp.]|uniref:redox-sensing transcriptional repressor Rex n=1 Tax=Zhihengliuella sp. TaxID=1954483 RepID=UPI002811B2C5|nr:redox-sensing transcriptional repressor Rex [Zhihengliuella sp.]